MHVINKKFADKTDRQQDYFFQKALKDEMGMMFLVLGDKNN